jgi:outer membrane protein W
MLKKALVLGAIASISSFSVAEQGELSYNFVGVGYQQAEILDEDFSGFGFYGSAAINESFFILGGYSTIESDNQFDIGAGPDDIDVTEFSLGIGFHTPISDTVDFVSTLEYADAEVESSGVSVDGNGYVLSAGVRAMLTDAVEIGGAVNYTDIEDESDTGVGIYGRYYTTDSVSIGVGFSTADDADSLSFDLRLDL